MRHETVSWKLIGFIRVYNLVWLAVVDLGIARFSIANDMCETKQANWPKWFRSPLDAFGGRLGKLSKAG